MLRVNPQLENAVSQIQSDHRELACVITAASYASDAQDRRDQSAAGQEEMTIVGPLPFLQGRPNDPRPHEQADGAPTNGIPDDVGRSFSSLGLRDILVLDLRNGISGFAKSNEHSLGEMNTFLVTFRDLVPRRAVPRAGMINESGFDGACYDDKGIF